MVKIFLSVKRSTSRGQFTHDWPIVTLYGPNARKWRTCGGGYALLGEVLGQWLEETQQKALKTIDKLPHNATLCKDGSVSVCGASGIEGVISLAAICGLKIEQQYDHKDRTVGFSVAPIEIKV